MTKEYRVILTGDRVKQFKMIGGNKIHVGIINDWRPPLVSRFTDAEGKRVNLRFIAESDDVELQAQIKNNFPANTKLGQEDRDALTFVKGILKTSSQNVITYLDSIPENAAFTGDRNGVIPQFEEYIHKAEVKKSVGLGLIQAKAIIVVNSMEEDELINKLLKIKGSTYEVPKDRDGMIEAFQFIISDVDGEDSEIFEIIGDAAVEDSVTLIGRAVNAGVLSFVNKGNQLQIKRNGEWNDFYAVSDQHTETQKQELLRDRINTVEGKSLVTALKEAIRIEKERSESAAPTPAAPIVPTPAAEEPKPLTDEELKMMYELRFGATPAPEVKQEAAEPAKQAEPAKTETKKVTTKT